MKNIIDGTMLKIEASLAAVVVRIDALDEQVKKFRDHGRDHDGLVSAIKALSGRVDQVEGRVVNGGVSPNSGSVPTRGHLPEKSMLPKVFEGNLEEWRNWQDDVSDFLDTRHSGMLRFLDAISKQRDQQISDSLKQTWQFLGPKVLDDEIHVWRALKGLTGGVARTVVMSVSEENGFEAWRRLHLQFEPKLTIRQGQVLAEFAAMVSRPGKTITETPDLIAEKDRKLKLIRDLTHEGVSDVHALSVLIGLLDPMTRQHAAHKQGGGV